jgi:hypothetical protein
MTRRMVLSRRAASAVRWTYGRLAMTLDWHDACTYVRVFLLCFARHTAEPLSPLGVYNLAL